MTVIVDRIETERLVLRPFEASDAERVLDIHSRLEVIRWLSNPPFVPMASLQEAHDWIRRANAKPGTDPLTCSLAVQLRAGALLGSVGISRLERIDGRFVGEYETGWHLHPDAGGQGYATEAAAALTSAALSHGHERLVIDMYPDNLPSIGVALRLGAHDLGELEDPWYGATSRIFELVR
ncbi:GNAT family N-acetyltransferase [Aeromicrobium sp. CF4.19]|uniref:GNAT family N-acetyltransferase n=1 Tax=Aeromicrobium sp. CF4.19 TaxID=3373082 RepID=UPI003EE73033